VAIAYYIFMSKNKEKARLDPGSSDPTYTARLLKEKKQVFY